MKLLFVCTGNICRSPTAERLAAVHAVTHDIENLSVASAGTRAVIGHPIHPEAARAIRELGGHADGFSARQLTAQLANEADLVITMTTPQRDAVLELAPQKLHRTFALAEAALLVSEHGARTIEDLAARRPRAIATESHDIVDPIGQPPAVFTAVGRRIAELLPSLLQLRSD